MSPPFHAASEEGRAIWHMGALMQFKATGEDTGGRFWLAEHRSARGYTAPVRRHTREDELYIVLEGEITVEVDGKSYPTPAGSVAYAPRGLPHTFRVESETVRFLIFATPAGFERWFLDTGRPAESLTIPPPVTEVPDIGRLVASLAAYGVEVLGMPPGIDEPAGR
jgi:mannose-6-phosphate isomerase-like protein (cupin superfamily)